MTPKQLAVLADHLRSILPKKDAADVARWAAHPEAVRELLRTMPYRSPGLETRECANCTATEDETHFRDCRVAAAWRALGDPRGAADIERAHEEALQQNVRLFPQWQRDMNGAPVTGPANGANRGDLVEVRVGVGGEMRMERVVDRAADQFLHAINTRIEEAFRNAMVDHRLTIETGRGRLSRTQEQIGDLSRTEILVDGVPVWRVDARLGGGGLALGDHPLPVIEPQPALARSVGREPFEP